VAEAATVSDDEVGIPHLQKAKNSTRTVVVVLCQPRVVSIVYRAVVNRSIDLASCGGRQPELRPAEYCPVIPGSGPAIVGMGAE